MPIIALIVGFVVVLAVLRSWSRPRAAATEPPTTSDERDDLLPPDEDARLEQELARFRHGQARGGGVSG
jgi:hypothetical protein